MEKGEPPNAKESQVTAAVAAGLNAAEARAVLEDRRAYAAETSAKLDAARRDGVSGVPSFRIGGHEVATGAQSAEWWEEVLRRWLIVQHQDARQQAVAAAS